MKHRITIRGMAMAVAVVAVSTGPTLGATALADYDEPQTTTESSRASAPVARAQAAGLRASRSTTRAAQPSGSTQRIAARMAAQRYGWGADQFACLDSLWERESGWSHTAVNSSSGAYGIPQALPASKMGAHGSDWRTNPVTQIRWGLAYIDSTYGSPCSAWNFFGSKGWY